MTSPTHPNTERGLSAATLDCIARFMGEQEEREAVVDWLRSVGDRKPHGTDWRTYYEIADAIELEQHRRLATPTEEPK